MATPADPGLDEVRRFGLSQVYSPVGDAEVDIVFVHGLDGDPHLTWTSDKSKTFWPKQLLPHILKEKKACILVYGYDASVGPFIDRFGKISIHYHAEHLVKDLMDNRRTRSATERSLIFVAHSLGGLVVKQALIISSEMQLHSIHISTYGIVFLGSPHYGNLVDWTPQLAMMIGAATPLHKYPIHQEQILNRLQKNCTGIQNINQQFAQIISRYRTYFFHEEKPTNLQGMSYLPGGMQFIVNQECASPNVQDVERAGIYQDHFHMCKFENENSPGFNLVAEGIERYANDAPDTILKRWKSVGKTSLAKSSPFHLPAQVHRSELWEPGVGPDILSFNEDTNPTTFSTDQGTLEGFRKSSKRFNLQADPNYEIPHLTGGGRFTKSGVLASESVKERWRFEKEAKKPRKPRTILHHWDDSEKLQLTPATPILHNAFVRNDWSPRSDSLATAALAKTLERDRAERRSRSRRRSSATISSGEATDQGSVRSESPTKKIVEAIKLVSQKESKVQTKLLLECNGRVLSWRASMLCLTLASCACDQVPTFFFTRPYSPTQRRWNRNGEIEQKEVPKAIALPQWPKDLFVEVEESDWELAGSDILYEDTAVGYPPVAVGKRRFTVEADIADLVSWNFISVDLLEDYLLLTVHPAVKEALWDQTSIDDRLLVWFDLLKLVVFSFPDMYAEIMWQPLQWQCRSVVRSTVLPFLSVVGWPELSAHTELVLPLMSFLMHYSICDSSGLDLSVLFESETMAKLHNHFDLGFFEKVAAYQCGCRLLLLNAQTTQGSEAQNSLSDLKYYGVLASSNQSVEGPIVSGLVGLVLDSQIRSVRPTIRLELADSMVREWEEFFDTETSSFERCAGLLLSADRNTTDIGNSVSTSVVADVEVTATLAQAMISRGSSLKAYAMLKQCVKGFWRQRRTPLEIEVPMFFILLGLIQCCNINKIQDFKASDLELFILNSPSYVLRCYLLIETADWYIGQGIYTQAEEYLVEVLQHAQIPNYLGVIAHLRLNKVHRRLRDLEVWPLFRALKLVDHTNSDMSNECLDELHATLAFARWNGLDIATDAKSVLAANTTTPEESWRLSALEEQCEGMRACILGLQDGMDAMATDEEPGPDALDEFTTDHIGSRTLNHEMELDIDGIGPPAIPI